MGVFGGAEIGFDLGVLEGEGVRGHVMELDFFDFWAAGGKGDLEGLE